MGFGIPLPHARQRIGQGLLPAGFLFGLPRFLRLLLLLLVQKFQQALGQADRSKCGERLIQPGAQAQFLPRSFSHHALHQSAIETMGDGDFLRLSQAGSHLVQSHRHVLDQAQGRRVRLGLCQDSLHHLRFLNPVGQG